MKIALLGYGVEGQSAYRYYSFHFPDARFTVYDNAPLPKFELPPGVEFKGNQTDFHHIKADYIIRTPSIPPQKVSGLGKVTSVTREFFENSPAPIIGVTGTKGKGTTCSLVAEILKAAGRKVWLVGNIGLPALDVLDKVQPGDIVVYELSSFQLWDLKQSPHIAVVLGIEPEHLDVHSDAKEYVQAKANIAAYQTKKDTIVFYKNNPLTRQVVVHSLARKVPYPDDTYAHVKDGYFWYGSVRLCSVQYLRLPGAHNQDNACAAIAASWHWVKSDETIARGLENFEGLPHRLKFVREVNDVQYFDDSYSTTPESTIAAVRAFEQPKVLILGGSHKGADFTELASLIQASTIRQVLLIGNDEAQRIKELLEKTGFANYRLLGKVDMPQIVQAAQEIVEPGDVVLLSPACASFDMFKNVIDRGEQFVAAVQAL